MFLARYSTLFSLFIIPQPKALFYEAVLFVYLSFLSSEKRFSYNLFNY